MFFSVNKFTQKQWLGAVLILLTGVIIYANTFSVPFFLDDLDATGYHVVNLIIHLGSTLLVYLLLHLTLGTPYWQLT